MMRHSRPAIAHLQLLAHTALLLLLVSSHAFVPVTTRRGFRAPALSSWLSYPSPSTFQTRTETSLYAVGSGSIATLAVGALRAGATHATKSRNWALVASGGAGDVADIVVSAYDWCTNLGAPAALVAGAVIATIYENVVSGDLDVLASDSKWVKMGKRMTKVLLLSAFALEVISIFVTTVTGTMLLSRSLDRMDKLVAITESTTPLGFLRSNFEFEYLTARITFLQGLMNWLGAIALGHIVPNTGANDGRGETKSTEQMNKFIGSALLTTTILMMTFYNNHMTFYPNYGVMLLRWATVLMKRFIFCWPVRPLALFFIPSMAATIFYGVKAFLDGPNLDPDEDTASQTS